MKEQQVQRGINSNKRNKLGNNQKVHLPKSKRFKPNHNNKDKRNLNYNNRELIEKEILIKIVVTKMKIVQ